MCLRDITHLGGGKTQLWELEVYNNYTGRSLVVQDTYYQMITPLNNERENQHNIQSIRVLANAEVSQKEFAMSSGKI